MKARRGLWIGVLLTALLAVTGASVFWAPYDADAVFRAIPAEAALVTLHSNTAARWPALAALPWAQPLSAALKPGAGPGGARTARLARFGLARLTRDLVLAYAPRTAHGEAAWYGSAWIGPWAPVMRWILSFGQPPGVRAVGSFGGQTIWAVPAGQDAGRHLSVACAEGRLLACWSADPMGVRRALMAADSAIPATRARAVLAGLPRPVPPDAAWAFWAPFGAGRSASEVLGGLEACHAQGLSAEVRIRPAPFRQAPLRDVMDLTALARALGTLPVAVLALPLDTLRNTIPAPAPSEPAWLDPLRRWAGDDLLRAESNGLVAALFTDDYAGGVGRAPFRLTVPALMVFTKLRYPDRVPGWVARELDLLNARYRLGLIPDPIARRAGLYSVVTIEMTSHTARVTLDPDDRPAYAIVGEWLILSSNTGSLVKLLRRTEALGAEAPFEAPAWQAAAGDVRTSGLLWVDLDRGGRLLQLAVSLWGLSRRGPGVSDPTRWTRPVHALLENLRPMRQAVARLEPEGADAVLRLEIGAAAAGP